MEGMEVMMEGNVTTDNYSWVFNTTTLDPLWNESAYDVIDGNGYTAIEAVFIGVFLSVIIFFSIAGNILVVIAVFTDYRLRKPSNYFIVSLAVADLLVAILVMTFAVVNDILGYWIFGTHFCTIWISFDIMCSTASILNLCAISFDRYIHIRDPFQYEMWMTSKKIYSIIAMIWALSCLISFLPVHLGLHRLGLKEDPTTVELTGEHYICMLRINPLYAVISSCISFYLPCFIMIFIYFKMFAFARQQVKSIKKHCVAVSNGNGDSRTPNYKISDHKAAVTLGVIMGTFLFCWLPFFTINIVGSFCNCIPTLMILAFTWLGYFNSTLNPVIYSIFNQEFREAFKKILKIKECVSFKKIDFKVGRTVSRKKTAGEYGALSQKSSEDKDLRPDHVTTV